MPDPSNLVHITDFLESNILKFIQKDIIPSLRKFYD